MRRPYAIRPRLAKHVALRDWARRDSSLNDSSVAITLRMPAEAVCMATSAWMRKDSGCTQHGLLAPPAGSSDQILERTTGEWCIEQRGGGGRGRIGRLMKGGSCLDLSTGVHSVADIPRPG